MRNIIYRIVPAYFRRLLFGKTRALDIDSSKVLNIFTQTATQLQSLNGEIDKHAQEKEATQKALQLEIEHLVTLKENHEKVIGKLNKIFE